MSSHSARSDYDYRPWHIPPLQIDRVGVRPGEHLAAVFAMLIGGILLISMAMPEPIIGIYRLPDIVYLVIGALTLAGGSLSLAGLQWPRKTMSVGWAVERVGCLVSCVGWIAAAIVLTQVKPILVFGVIVSVFAAIFCILRFRLLNQVELLAREDVRKDEH